MNIHLIETIAVDQISTYRCEADIARLLGARPRATSWLARLASRRAAAARATPIVSGPAGCCA